MRALRQLWRDEDGLSIVEIGVSLVITSLMSVALVTWIDSAGAAASLHREDDVVVQDLRIAKERITRELRVAESVSGATAGQVTVWVDSDDDDFPDSGEQVTWAIQDGSLLRWTDTTESQVFVSNLISGSAFGFDSPTPADVGSITITLVAQLEPDDEGDEPGERRISTQVHLRNSS